ncbi:MAG: ferritin-like domain-containing protein [Pseudomonadales bacterium]|jgi:hypothetical protein|nr:ferritin-like domain-containing protein [Pseudomonadales bacterium]MBP9033567.1 ferritin-like domain-containing protein [Pseudomonadales bacterium]
MGVQFVIDTPSEVRYFDQEAQRMDAGTAQQVAEIFQTPLTGCYNWDYRVQDDRIRKLYELGKQLNWNVETDIDWNKPRTRLTPEQRDAIVAFKGYGPYEALSEEQKQEFAEHENVWTLSQFLHGEQGALLVASQLTSCAPTLNAKLYAASQTFDEARHVEVFNKYLQTKAGYMYPVDPALKSLLDKILTDPRWDLKFIGMQLIIEGLALSAFTTMKATTPKGELLNDVVELVLRDEARHVTFGINYLEEHLKSLSEAEREERARFAYEACVVARERMIPKDVFHHWGWNVEEARRIYLEGEFRQMFRNLMFMRVMPNLRRIGLLTDSVRPLFEQLGMLEYENLKDDGDIDWAELSRPLFTTAA